MKKAVMQKTSFISLLTIALMGCFVLLSSPAYGVSILPVDTLIQQAYLRAQEDGFKSLTKSLSQGGNVYDNAYKLARKNALGSISEAFSSVAENLNAQYECSLTPSDVSNIVASDPIMNASFAGFAGKAAFSVDNEALVRSCIRVAQCAKRQEPSSASQLAEAYTQETYPLCRQVVQQAYNNTISITVKQQTLDAANHGDDIFYNGSLDDSPYDLLLDMQLIGDVLFKSNTAAPQVILYDFPGAGGAGGSFTFFDPSGNGGTNVAFSSAGSNSNNNGSAAPADGSVSAGSASAGTVAGASLGAIGGGTVKSAVSAGASAGVKAGIAGNASISTTTSSATAGGAKTALSASSQTSAQTKALQQLTMFHQSLKAGTAAGNQGTTSVTLSTSTTSQGLVCVAPTGTTPATPVLTPAQISANQVVEATSLEQALDTFNTAINAPAALYSALTSPEMQNNNSTLTAVSNLGAPASGTNGGNGSNGNNSPDPNEAANSCISKCDALAPADKAVCVAKCLCGTKYSDNGIFGISVCTVPTTQTEVIGGKSVKSVEEIVDEINAVLTALRNSGQLMKHTRTKEFLDTSLSKIKLNQILSFDMNIAFKPIYDSETNKEKEEAKKSQETASADKARQGTYTEGNIGQEKNKYIVLSNPVKQQQAAEDLADNPSPAPATSIEPTLPQDLAKTLNNDMLNSISDFMQQNAELRQQVGETLNGINTTAGNLEKKIQKAKQ